MDDADEEGSVEGDSLIYPNPPGPGARDEDNCREAGQDRQYNRVPSGATLTSVSEDDE